MWKVLLVIVFALAVAPIDRTPGEDNVAASRWQSENQIDTSVSLTLDQCIKIALKQSPGMRAASLNLTLAKLDVDDARANYLPQVSVSGQYRFSDDVDFGWERQNYDAQIATNYTIWDHGRREAGLAQAKTNTVAVQSDYDRTRQNLIYSITGAYYDLLQAERLIDVNEKLLEISSGNVAKVTAFQEKGKAIPADVAAARVQQASDELSLINAQNNFDLARAELASLMGLDPRTPLEIVSVDESLPLPGKGAPMLEDTIAKAIQDRPELSRLRARAISLEWSLRQAQLDRWPVLSAQCDFNVLLDDYLREREDFKEYRNWSAAVRVSFPIFDGGASRRREQNAEIAVQQMKDDLEEQERSIMLEVQQSYLSLERAGKSLDIAGKQVQDATLSLDATQGRYEQGMVIFLEVLSAQARYAQALTSQVRAFYEYKMAEKALLKVMGALEVED